MRNQHLLYIHCIVSKTTIQCADIQITGAASIFSDRSMQDKSESYMLKHRGSTLHVFWADYTCASAVQIWYPRDPGLAPQKAPKRQQVQRWHHHQMLSFFSVCYNQILEGTHVCLRNGRLRLASFTHNEFYLLFLQIVKFNLSTNSQGSATSSELCQSMYQFMIYTLVPLFCSIESTTFDVPGPLYITLNTGVQPRIANGQCARGTPECPPRV